MLAGARFFMSGLAVHSNVCSTEWMPPSFVHPFNPPRKVWIKVRKLLPQPWDHGPRRPDGLRIEAEAPGMLHEWMYTEDGDRLGLVTYLLETADGQWSLTVTQPAPAHLIRWRGVRRRDREAMSRRRTHG